MESNNDILNRVRLLMGYDMSMTLTENLVMEQTKYGTIDRTIPSVGSDYFSSVKQQQTTFVKYKQFCDNNPSKCHVIEGNTVQEILSNLRDFFIDSYLGMVTDLVISILGVEFGGPYIMRALEIAFLMNDLDIYSRQPKEFQDRKFFTKLNDQKNKSFSNLITDIVVVGSLGLIKGSATAINLVKSSYDKFLSMVVKLLTNIPKIKPFLSKIPKLGPWMLERLKMFEDFLTSIKNPKPKITNKITSSTMKTIKLKYGRLISDVLSKNPKLSELSIVTTIATILWYISPLIFEGIKDIPWVEKFVAEHSDKPEDVIARKLTEDRTVYYPEIEARILEKNPQLSKPIKILDPANGVFESGVPPIKYQVVNSDWGIKKIT